MSLYHVGRSNVPGLIAAGPVIQVQLAPGDAFAAAMEAAGRQVPVLPAMMMIDTGAQLTVIEDKIATQLQLAPFEYRPVTGVSQKAEMCPVYRVAVIIGMGAQKTITSASKFVKFEADIVGMPSPATPALHVGLLGRDFLQHVRFTYDGPKGEFDVCDYSHDHSQVEPTGADKVAGYRARQELQATKKAARKAAKEARRNNRKK